MIEVKNLSWKANNNVILKDINLQIQKDDFVAIIGPNGAGKSTLLKLLLNIIPIQSGEIFFNNQIHSEYLTKNPVAYLPQREEVDLSFPIKIVDIVLLGRMYKKKLFKRFTKNDFLIADKMLDLVGISHLKNEYIGTVSGGEFQRMLLARALATESKLIFLDEPEAGIDRKGIISFFQLLKKLNQMGHTIITISHDLHILSDFCTMLVCLNKTLHCHSHPSKLKAIDFQNTFGQDFHLIRKDY